MYDEKVIVNDQYELVIREVQVSDAQALLDHLVVVDSETRYLAREEGELTLTLEEEEVLIQGIIDSSDRINLVGLVDGMVVCTSGVGINSPKRRFKHRATMGIVVRKNYWGQGLGKILMQKCIDWCKNNDVEQLELEVVTTNERAIGLYKNFGFKIQGTKRHAMKYRDGSYADEHFMVLDLVEKSVEKRNS